MHTCFQKLQDGTLVRAVFNPHVGMNLMSLRFGEIEVIDPCTMHLFTERMAGLGALIGPHFHHRKKENIPNLKLDSLFPFVSMLSQKGQDEPFSHGIARYVPWKYTGEKSSIKALLSGDDTYKNFKLKELEGYDFDLSYEASIDDKGLRAIYSMTAEKPSVIGMHYYYRLPEKTGVINSQVLNEYHHPEGWRKIPSNWLINGHNLNFDLEQNFNIDFGFRPSGLKGVIDLKTSEYTLRIAYESLNEAHAWQVYHPQKESFVCIEPVSAENPRVATSTKAQLTMHLSLLRS